MAADVDSPAEPLLIGRLLCGKWRVERLLGVGGMSTVYAATHRNGNRVAIKVLKRELAANAPMRLRFLREGYIANRVGHEGATRVMDDDVTEEGLFFLVMELAEGESLEAHCERHGGSLPAARVVQLSEQLLDVVVAAHAQNIIHRDIKPSNVFVTGGGAVKLLDFGIAVIREGAGVSQTASGALLGTPAFMSPEQTRGRHAEVDGRADVWAVGATMFRLLSGRLVHVYSNPNETMIATATVPAPSLANLRPDLPRALTRVVDQALKLDPDDRFQTADSMRAALRSVDRSELIENQRSSHASTARWDWSRLVLLAVPLCLVASAALALVPRSPHVEPRESSSATISAPAVRAQSTTEPAPSAAVSPTAPSSAAEGVLQPSSSTQRPPEAGSSHGPGSLHIDAKKRSRPPSPRSSAQGTNAEPAPPVTPRSRSTVPESASSAPDLNRILGSRR